ncbi:helix-turn-helix domain-containing protein [Radicibacter daui]|uniref:helix-turn-helix domain-containing protein n=1 Tax=Radicibacter daui TaxID=3064829 RepID=UPI004046FAB2
MSVSPALSGSSSSRRNQVAAVELLSVEPIQPALSRREWVLADHGARRTVHAVLLTGGEGRLKGRDGVLALTAPGLVWLPAGEAERLQVDAAGSGYLLKASEDLLMRCVADSAEAPSLRHLAARTLLLEGERLAPALPELPAAFEAIRQELRALEPGAMAALRARFTLLLLLLWRRAGLAAETESERAAGSEVMERFAHLIERHYREHWRVGDYARALGITTDHLHALCQREAAAGPLVLVHRRLVAEACLRLVQTGQPVEQIAYSLGFRDAAYFNRFFRRLTGSAPGAWRRRQQELAPQEASTYAAWP